MKILLVEDDLSLAGGLSLAIEKQGFELEVARTAKEAERSWADGKFDLVLLDVSLPDGSGFDICREIRRTSKVPIIFLTASDEEIDVVTGLEIGGDDYITKPFKLAVLISRINAVLRRTNDYAAAADTELSSGGIKIDLLKGRVYKNGVALDLTAGEYKLLRLFMENPNTILSPERILSKLWDCDERFVDNNTLTVYIRRLRAKIEDEPSEPKLIITVRRMGYKWNDTE
ncbi:MAG TPA: response regulator transcription factor [Firmicutes bacterium]|nr:response regulator transcription factor [Bacillota bacterium]